MADEVIRPMVIDGRKVGPGYPAWIIAEIGINHQGDVGQCAAMVEAAAAAGADAIKLQTVDADASYVKSSPSYQLFKDSALTREETAAIFRLARERGLAPFTTSADLATIAWVDRLEPAAHKISSGLLTTTPILRQVARTGRPVIMSTGMSVEAEIDEAVSVAQREDASNLALLHCTSIYPAPPDTLSLATISWMQQRWRLPVGFSDHSRGEVASPLAVVAGACIVEKHFTLDATLPGYDHHISLDQAGFARMAAAIRDAEKMRGIPGRTMTAAELEIRKWAHRVVVARTRIRAGERFDEHNTTFKRPAPGQGERGVPPSQMTQLYGHVAARDISEDTPIVPADICDWEEAGP